MGHKQKKHKQKRQGTNGENTSPQFCIPTKKHKNMIFFCIIILYTAWKVLKEKWGNEKMIPILLSCNMTKKFENDLIYP